VIVAATQNAGATLTATYGGVAMTSITQIGSTGALFKLSNPPTGAQTIVVNSDASAAMAANSVSYIGVGSVGGPSAGTNTNFVGGSVSVTVASAAFHVVVAMVQSNATSYANFTSNQPSPQTRFSNSTPLGLILGDVAGAASVTLTTAVGGGSSSSGFIGVDLTPA
jgi:hypothetical protein